MRALLADLRLAARFLRRQPAFTITSLGIIALGIGVLSSATVASATALPLLVAVVAVGVLAIVATAPSAWRASRADVSKLGREI